jgi:group I intron endonuclease
MKLKELNKEHYSIPCVYKWENLINHKIYIGQTMNLYQRYLCMSSNSVRPRMKLDIQKYGIENFELTILEDNISDRKTLIEREKYWITYYDSANKEKGYNTCPWGSSQPNELNGMYGKHVSEECKQKLREWLAEQWQKEEYRQTQHDRMSGKNNIMYDVHLNGELNPMYGKHHSAETRKKISERLKGKPQYQCRKKVRCIETDMIFDSVSECAKYFNISPSYVSNVLHHYKGLNSIRGYSFEYVEEN